MMKRLHRWIHQPSQRGSLGAEPAPDPNRQVAEVVQALGHLEERLRRLRTATENLSQLQQIQARLADPDLALVDEELKALQQQAETLELTVSQQVLSWKLLQEPFWQAIRFGGLGLVMGWLLRGWVSG